MASSVRAAVLVKPKTLEAREFARPAIGLDDGLLRIEACASAAATTSSTKAPSRSTRTTRPIPSFRGTSRSV
jgi:hypothetical protein